jgi:two-component system sensor histidine kinase TctE
MNWLTHNFLKRKKRFRRSLFGQILEWMLAPLMLLWPMSITITYLVAKSISNTPFDRALSDNATALSHLVKIVNGQPTLSNPIPVREMLRADTSSIDYQILDAQGHMIASDGDEISIPLDELPIAGLVQFRNEISGQGEKRVAYIWVNLPTAKTNPAALVQVAETLEKRNQLAYEIIKGVILPQCVILPIGIALLWFGLAKGISPLNALQEKIRQRKPDDLSALDTENTPEELVPLISALNDQLTRLEQNLNTQKRFIADAAHQLKTPLAGLRMQSELLMRTSDREHIQKILKNIHSATERATRLVNQMLSLARTETPHLTKFELIDLVEIARNVLRDFVPESLQKNIDLGFEAPNNAVYIIGQGLMLSEMLKNLIDNAIRYTPPFGTITMRIEDSNNKESLLLEVEDTGPGIPEADRELVFERFYRILGTQADGSGLGLAIVREIVNQHKAHIAIYNNPRATSKEQPGTLIRISFAPAIKEFLD